MMSNFENGTLLNCELPRSTQSFEKMLDEVGQALDDVTRTRTVSTAFSELLCLTGINDCEEIESADNKAVNKSSDGNSLSIYSLCTTCTQCKLGKKLNGDFDDIGTAGIESDKKVSSVSECDGLSLFVDQINSKPTAEGREHFPKRYFSDTVTDSRLVPAYSCKRFKSEGFSSARKLRSNSGGGKIEQGSTIRLETREISARYCHGGALPGNEDPSELAELNYNNDQRTNDSLVSLEASADPDGPNSEELAQIESTDNVLGQVSSHTLEVDNSTSPRSNIKDVRFPIEARDGEATKNSASILEHESLSPNPSTSVHPVDPYEFNSKKLAQTESTDNVVGQITVSFHTVGVDSCTSALSSIDEVRLADETKDDDVSKNAASVLEHESLSPNPSTSVFSQNTIEEVYQIEEDHHGNDFKNKELIDDTESRSLISCDPTLNQSTVTENHYVNATDDIDCSKSIQITEREKTFQYTKEWERPEGRRKPLKGEIVEETAIDSDTALQIDAGLVNVEKQRIETNPETLGFMNSLESVNVENNKVKVFNDLETEAEVAKKSLNSADEVRSVEPNIDAVKNEKTSRILDESILEVSIDSEKIYVEMNSRENRQDRTTRAPVDLTTINKKRVSENAGAGKSKEVMRDEKKTEVLNPVYMVPNPPANFIPSEDTDDTSLDFLSESELERIEKEAYTRSNKPHINANLTNVNLDEDDRFYRPNRHNTETKNEDNPVLPSWVTNPAPEPNYDVIRRRNQWRKKYINKILQEVLRLSEIISKVAKAMRAEQEVKDSDTIPQIQNPHPGRSAEDYSNSNVRASTSTDNRGEDSDLFYAPQSSSRPKHIARSIEPVASNCSDIFYAPQSLGRCKRKEPPSLSNNVTIHGPVKLEASINTVDAIKANYSVKIREPDKFYVPQSGKSKYDASFIFAGQKDKASFSYSNTEATSFYNPSVNSGFSKRDWSGNKTGGYSSIPMNDRRLESRKSGESQLAKNRLQASFESDTRNKTENGNINRTNNCKAVSKDAVFYSPDNSSSASSIYTRLPSVQNSRIFFSENSDSEKFGSGRIPAKPTSLNFGKNLIARTNRNDNDSVFYSGNK